MVRMLSLIAGERGNGDEADALLEHSTAMFRELGDTRAGFVLAHDRAIFTLQRGVHVALSLRGLAAVAAGRGQLESAARLVGGSTGCSTSCSGPWPAGSTSPTSRQRSRPAGR